MIAAALILLILPVAYPQPFDLGISSSGGNNEHQSVQGNSVLTFDHGTSPLVTATPSAPGNLDFLSIRKNALHRDSDMSSTFITPISSTMSTPVSTDALPYSCMEDESQTTQTTKVSHGGKSLPVSTIAEPTPLMMPYVLSNASTAGRIFSGLFPASASIVRIVGQSQYTETLTLPLTTNFILAGGLTKPLATASKISHKVRSGGARGSSGTSTGFSYHSKAQSWSLPGGFTSVAHRLSQDLLYTVLSDSTPTTGLIHSTTVQSLSSTSPTITMSAPPGSGGPTNANSLGIPGISGAEKPLIQVSFILLSVLTGLVFLC